MNREPNQPLTTFSADEGGAHDTSLHAFGAAFIFVWAAMLAYVFLTRRRQLALRARVDRIEAHLHRIPRN